MNEEQKAAFLMSQVAMLNAQIAGMVAENQYREAIGESPAYNEADFQREASSSGCDQNSAITTLRSGY